MKKGYLAETENIIALCHIIDDFEDFEERLIPVISSKYNRDFVFQLLDISKGKFKIGARKAKKFYKENKTIIDIINQYSNIASFINDNYRWDGKSNGNLQFFYEYLSNYREEIEQILKVLEKLKELGFRKFEIDEQINFTKKTYEASPIFRENFDITYVANPEIIPSYTSNIKYKTTNSNYEIKLGINGKEISKYCKEIILNSLMFNPSTLPVRLDRKNTHELLKKLKDEQKDVTEVIRGSVDFGINVLDLEKQFNYTNEVIMRLNSVANKEQLVEVLSSVKQDIEKLKTLTEEYDNSILEQEPLLTPEILAKEKNLYLERRFRSNIDSC